MEGNNSRNWMVLIHCPVNFPMNSQALQISIARSRADPRGDSLLGHFNRCQLSASFCLPKVCQKYELPQHPIPKNLQPILKKQTFLRVSAGYPNDLCWKTWAHRVSAAPRCRLSTTRPPKHRGPGCRRWCGWSSTPTHSKRWCSPFRYQVEGTGEPQNRTAWNQQLETMAFKESESDHLNTTHP